jgi:hypothetical protein
MEKSNSSINLNIIAILLYNLCLVAGTAYLVAVYDWSPWWFLLTVVLLSNYIKTNVKDDK